MTTLLGKITKLREDYLGIWSVIDWEMDDFSPEQMADLLIAFRSLAEDHKAVVEKVESKLIQSGETLVTSSSGATIEVLEGEGRKSWRHDELGQLVARRISDLCWDPETGERLLDPEQAIQKMLDYAAPSYWRVKALKELGINANEFCELTEPKTSIMIRKASK